MDTADVKDIGSTTGIGIANNNTTGATSNAQDGKGVRHSPEVGRPELRPAFAQNLHSEGKEDPVLLTPHQIDNLVSLLAAKINGYYRPDPGAITEGIVIIAVLDGVFVFLSDLVRKLHMPVEIHFVKASSYGDAMNPSQEVKIRVPEQIKLTGRDVLVVDDIYGTGGTMRAVMKYVKTLEPKSIKSCTFLVHIANPGLIDFFAAIVPQDFFVYGYGFDLEGGQRHLPYLFGRRRK